MTVLALVLSNWNSLAIPCETKTASTGDFQNAVSGYRYYSPSLGRWISRDPVEEGDGPNIYAFVGNSPINRFDPFGLSAEDDDWDLDLRLEIAAHASGYYATYAYDADLRFMHQQVMDQGVETMKREGREIAIGVGMTIGGGIAGKIVGKIFGSAARAISRYFGKADDQLAKLPIGSRGRGETLSTSGNLPGKIGSREYSGHAFDQMRNRGIMPSVVENTIRSGVKLPGNTAAESVFFDSVNKIKVVVDKASGRVVTVMHTN